MDRVTKEDLVATIRADRAEFDAIVSRVPRNLLETPMLPGDWSVKDVLAHIAWGDREGIGVMRERALVGSDLWDLPEDERNAIVVNASRSQTLHEVISEYRSAFDGYLAAIEGLSDADLNEPDRFAGLSQRIPGWLPWRVVYDPGHYAEHGREIASAFERAPPRSTTTGAEQV